MRAKRLVLLSSVLALLLALVSVIHREDISDIYRSFVVPPLSSSCNYPPPAWITEIGRWARRHDLPGLQIHLRTDGMTYDCTFGTYIDEEGNSVPMDPKARLLFASVTKIFTSALAVMQFERGTVSADQRVYDLLNLDRIGFSNSKAWQDITLTMLLKHTAGFDRNLSGDPMLRPRPPCPKDFRGLRDITIDHAPGSTYRYSNLGYCLLGAALEHVTGENIDALFQEHLFDPLELNIVPATQLDDSILRSLTAYAVEQSERALLDSIDWESLTAVGNLTGTAQDLGKFLHLLMASGSPLNSIGRSLMTPEPDCDDSAWRTCHGLAFYSQSMKDGRRMFWRDGSLPGATAFAALTSDGHVFVLLGNGRDAKRWIQSHDELGRIIVENL